MAKVTHSRLTQDHLLLAGDLPGACHIGKIGKIGQINMICNVGKFGQIGNIGKLGECGNIGKTGTIGNHMSCFANMGTLQANARFCGPTMTMFWGSHMVGNAT